MTERFTSDLVFILIVLLVAALLGFLLGYLIQRQKCNKQCRKLEDEIEKQAGKLESCNREKQSLLAAIKEMQEKTFDAKAAAAALGTKVIKDDLKIIEGIGEKIAAILKNRGIDTWLKLSQANPDKIKEILFEDGGPQFNMHEPKTWPVQSLLANEGKWAELKKLQDELNAGK